MVRVVLPAPVIAAGLNPPLETPEGNPLSLETLKLTDPLNPLKACVLTVKVADCPGVTTEDEGDTVMAKSGLADKAQIVRVGGLGSELPLLSSTVSDGVYVPGVLKATLPGFWAVEVAGEPPGNTHEYAAAVLEVPKKTEPGPVSVASDVGELIMPLGAGVLYGVS